MIIRILTSLFIAALLIMPFGCERDVNVLEPATYPSFAEVFLDVFVAGLDYSAFGNSKLDAFEIDDAVAYNGSKSIKITVPGVNDPSGWYAGGAFYSKFPRDLSGYNALTFWAKASKTTVAEVGFGNDNTGNSLYTASQSGVLFGTSWQKYIIPIPLAEKLQAETGMFWYSAGADDQGLGCTIWFDEVKYEKLGTIAYPRIALADTLFNGWVGRVFDVSISGVTFNVDGTDQTINTSTEYFTLSSLDESVATITADGKIEGVGDGTAKILVKLGSLAEETITVKIDASNGPAAPAPTPVIPADSVLSLFSDAYTDHPGIIWNTYWEWSTTQTDDIQIGSDNIKLYTDLNFVGIEFTNPLINASEMTNFHMDIWTPNPTAAGQTFKIALVDFGPDGAYGGNDDSSHELTLSSPTLATQEWVSLDIPLSDFTGLTATGNLAQLVLSGDLSTVFVDNVYFHSTGGGGGGGPVNGPASPAPTPTQAAADVISMFSNAYTDVTIDTWNTGWQYSTTLLEEVQVQGDDVKLYTNLNFVGIEFASQTIDATSMDNFHMDLWTPDPMAAPAAFNIKLIDFGADGAWSGGDDSEHELTFTAPTMVSENWISLDIPLANFSGLTSRAHLAQMVLSSAENASPNTIYVDNVYFYSGGGGPAPTEPTTAAPTPTYAAADVMSVFSDAYTNLAGTNFYANWGQTTVVSEVLIGGNNTLLYSGLNYQGIELAGATDISSKTHLRVDVWTANSTALNIYLISPGPVETPYSVTVPTTGWTTLDIPLTAFSPVDLTNVIQFKFDGNGDIYLDNLLWH